VRLSIYDLITQILKLCWHWQYRNTQHFEIIFLFPKMAHDQLACRFTDWCPPTL